jgi:hypothetical protein
VEDRQADRLPVPSFPRVLTVPHALHPLLLAPKRPRWTRRCNAASPTRGQFGQRHLGGQVGGPMGRHTWEQTLGAHGQGHGIIAAGALSVHGARWLAADPRFLCPGRAWSTVLRGKFGAARARVGASAAAPRMEGSPALGTPEDVEQRRAQRSTKAWGVDAKAPLAGPAQVWDSRGRVTHRGAMANHRLLDGRAGWGRFASRHRRQGHRLQPMTRDADALIRRGLWHVWPRGFRRLRHDGFLANRHKARTRRRCRALLGQPAAPPQRRAKSVVQWMQEVPGIDLPPCPPCGARPLVRLPRPPLSPPTARQGVPLEPPRFDASSSYA